MKTYETQQGTVIDLTNDDESVKGHDDPPLVIDLLSSDDEEDTQCAGRAPVTRSQSQQSENDKKRSRDPWLTVELSDSDDERKSSLGKTASQKRRKRGIQRIKKDLAANKKENTGSLRLKELEKERRELEKELLELEKERLELQRLKKEHKEKERLEFERLEKERKEQEARDQQKQLEEEAMAQSSEGKATHLLQKLVCFMEEYKSKKQPDIAQKIDLIASDDLWLLAKRFFDQQSLFISQNVSPQIILGMFLFFDT